MSPQAGQQDPQALSAIAQTFVEARQQGRSLADFPGEIPPDLVTAYAVQDLGAWVLLPGQSDWQPWRDRSPVLIPFALPQMRNRFLALHAGGVVNPRNGRATLLLGNKLAGKTTVALQMAQHFGWPMLTDETAAIDTWSLQAWPLLRPPHVMGGDQAAKRFMQAHDMARNIRMAEISPVGRTVELVHAPGLATPQIQPLDSAAAAISVLFRHTLAFGSDNPTVSRALAALTQGRQHLRILHGGYAQLAEIAAYLETSDDP